MSFVVLAVPECIRTIEDSPPMVSVQSVGPSDDPAGRHRDPAGRYVRDP